MSLDDHINIIDLAVLRLETLSFRAQKYMDMHMVDFAIREILDPMKSIATSRKLDQGFIDSMSIVKMEFMKVGLAIDLSRKTSTGIPINKLLEFGWNGPYEIHGYPWLHWTGGKYGPGHHFAYGFVVHPGFAGYHLIETMQNYGFVQVFLQKLVAATSRWLEETAFK